MSNQIQTLVLFLMARIEIRKGNAVDGQYTLEQQLVSCCSGQRWSVVFPNKT